MTPVSLASCLRGAGIRSAYAAAWVQQVAGFAAAGLKCFASMARLSGQIGCSARTGFRIQAALIQHGLVRSEPGDRDTRRQPNEAKFRETLKNQGYAIRSVGGLLTSLIEQTKAEWRRKKEAKAASKLKRSREVWAPYRGKQAAATDERPRRQYRDFERPDSDVTPEVKAPVEGVPDSAWAAIGKAPKPPPE